MPYRFIVVLALFFLSPLFAGTITFGVVPQQSASSLITDWKPIISYLETATGEKIVLKTERSIPEFEKVLYSGGYDIAYMNPYHYAVAHKKMGYVAKVRDEKNIVGILVVRKDSGIRDIDGIKGKEFLFPSPDAFAATLLNKYELLKDHKIDLEKDKNFRYVNSHDSVYKGVARGVGDVGGGIERTFNDLDDQETKGALMILRKTGSYASHPFAIKASVPAQTQAKLTKALLHMPSEMLVSLKMKRLIETKDSEYESVRNIINVLPKSRD